MFDDFRQLQEAVARGTVAEVWDAISRERAFHPWERNGQPGHIPVTEFWSVQDAFAKTLGHPGLYAFVGWTGSEARVQYVGIAHDYSLGDRCRGRYMGSPTEGARQWTELKYASTHRDRLVLVPDHFSPRRRIDPAIYHPLPLPASKSHLRRIVRAERYAKCGLENTSFYPMPAPVDTTKKELEVIEKELIKATNAALFRHNDRMPPLLNVVHARSRVNPYVAAAYLERYNDWIDGSWWAPAPSR